MRFVEADVATIMMFTMFAQSESSEIECEFDLIVLKCRSHSDICLNRFPYMTCRKTTSILYDKVFTPSNVAKTHLPADRVGSTHNFSVLSIVTNTTY